MADAEGVEGGWLVRFWRDLSGVGFVEVLGVFCRILIFFGPDESARLEFIGLPEIAGVVMKEG